MITLIIGALLAIYAVSIYNKLVRTKNLVMEAWSGIDVMLKKRHDLIPNLVETVKGYASHERNTLELVINARSQALGANTVDEKEAAETKLSGALRGLFALAERYPDLKASANFQQLQSQVETMEGDIEKTRRYYNGTARELNTLIESFPGNLIASLFSFDKVTYFQLDNNAERNAPNIKF
jgi:LemA protein